MKLTVECPACCGAKVLMTPKETRGFEYKDCTLCRGSGEVTKEIADDYVFSLNEDNFIEEE